MDELFFLFKKSTNILIASKQNKEYCKIVLQFHLSSDRLNLP
jgi:hypothetical protein